MPHTKERERPNKPGGFANWDRRQLNPRSRRMSLRRRLFSIPMHTMQRGFPRGSPGSIWLLWVSHKIALEAGL